MFLEKVTQALRLWLLIMHDLQKTLSAVGRTVSDALFGDVFRER
jgi:hypothetical protein